MENKYRKEDSNIQINRVGLSTKYNVVSENIFFKNDIYKTTWKQIR